MRRPPLPAALGLIVVVAWLAAAVLANRIAVMRPRRIVRQGPRTKVLSPRFDDCTGMPLRSVAQMRPG